MKTYYLVALIRKSNGQLEDFWTFREEYSDDDHPYDADQIKHTESKEEADQKAAEMNASKWGKEYEYRVVEMTF